MNQNKPLLPESYNLVLVDIIRRINESRYTMIKKVSEETVILYWNIGRIVSEKVREEKWGDSIVEKLSKDLQSEYPGIRGFSPRNIWRMRRFHESYANSPILPPAVAEIGWVQNYILLEKCSSEIEREFYLKKIRDKGWSKNDLMEKIESHYFQNHLLAQNNFEKTVPVEVKAKVAWEFIDDYNIEILNPDYPIAEKEIENSIIQNIIHFLADMGGNFAFVGSQFKVEYREKEYFLDLLFFNFQLNCYVVFELKAREFSPKDLGQLQMYLLAVNEVIKKKDHGNTIGILICRDKDRVLVEYLLNMQNQPLGVATYNKYSHLKEIPQNIAKYLPSENEIIERLGFGNFKILKEGLDS